MMDSTVNTGMCRCCASEGAFKDIKSSYHWMGEEEIYSDMLRECFDIILNVSEHGDDGGICEVCITQLRNAINFKKQVLHTEEQFQKHLQNKTLFRPNIVKVEVQGEEDSDDNMGSGDEGFSGAEFEVPIKTEVDDPKPKKRAAKASATTTRASAKKAKADAAAGETSTKRDQEAAVVKQELNYIAPSETVGEKQEPIDRASTESIDETPETIIITSIESLRGKRETSNDTSIESENNLENIKQEPKITPKTELLKHRNSITEILLYSNATPIRRYEGIGYNCSYCPEQFERPADLKKHTLENHNNIAEANFMKKMNMSEYVVKIDITALKCKLCNDNMDTLNNLIHHLQNVHEKKIDINYTNHIFPFKFSDDLLRCMFCGHTFTRFRGLVAHMHLHYRNYICTICDSGFVNRNTFTQHASHHKTGTFVCDYCPKVFTTQGNKRFHERVVHTHGKRKYKCGYCKEMFKEHEQKVAHVASVHSAVALRLACQACDRVFNTRRKLNTHIKKDHLMEKSHKCTQCDMAFYSTTKLKSHMISHTGLKEYQCSVCLKFFGRRKTLNVHMKTHAKKVFECEHCNQKYTQKNNLKAHLKSKHGING